MIIQKSINISCKKTIKNRIIWCVIPEDDSVRETMFKNIFRDLTKKLRERVIISSKSLCKMLFLKIVNI